MSKYSIIDKHNQVRAHVTLPHIVTSHYRTDNDIRRRALVILVVTDEDPEVDLRFVVTIRVTHQLVLQRRRELVTNHCDVQLLVGEQIAQLLHGEKHYNT